MDKLLGRPRPVDSRNRISLPPQILEILNLKPNDYAFFRIENNKIIIGKALVKYEFIDQIINNKKSNK